MTQFPATITFQRPTPFQTIEVSPERPVKVTPAPLSGNEGCFPMTPHPPYLRGCLPAPPLRTLPSFSDSRGPAAGAGLCGRRGPAPPGAGSGRGALHGEEGVPRWAPRPSPSGQAELGHHQQPQHNTHASACRRATNRCLSASAGHL